MTHSEAKQVLKLYRPGTADAADPSFAEALAWCERDAELKMWFEEHCALYSAMRAKFKQIVVPEGLKQQIIAERKVHTSAVPVWQKAVLAVGAVAAAALIVFEIRSNWQPPERRDFAAYSGYMVGVAERGYGMQDYTNDLNQIHQFLLQSDSIADYKLPKNLQKNATAAGCVATTWQGNKVSMICFTTGRPLKGSAQSDLWLFVTDRSTARDTPTSATPTFKQIGTTVTASWTVGNRTYVLATEGDKTFLEQYL